MRFLRLSLTQSANLMGLTPAIVGFAVARRIGLEAAAASIVLACTLTALMGSVSAAMAVAYGQPAAALSRHILGPLGPRLVGAALGTTLVGWFSLHAMALLQALPALTESPRLPMPRGVFLLASAAVSLWVVRAGNQGIARINAVQGPLMVTTMAWAAWRNTSWQWHGDAFVPNAACTAMIFAAGLGDVVDLPSVMHRASSRAAAVGAAWVSYGLVLPALLLLGAMLAQQPEATSAVSALAQGPLTWRVGVCGLAIGSACLGNAGLIYSGGLSMAAAFSRRPHFGWRAGVAVSAFLLSLSPVVDRLEPLLDFLGIATGSVGGCLLSTFVADGLVVRPARQGREMRVRAAGIAWAVACGLYAFVSGVSGACIPIACGLGALCGAAAVGWERAKLR